MYGEDKATLVLEKVKNNLEFFMENVLSLNKCLFQGNKTQAILNNTFPEVLLQSNKLNHLNKQILILRIPLPASRIQFFYLMYSPVELFLLL